MIRVDRSRVPEPKILLRGTGSPADRQFDEASAYYREERFRQRASFKFDVQRHRTVREALVTLFHNKCAYCETPLVSQPGDIELYRPKGGVLTADGAFLPQHYWWLALEWTNLYLSCIPCNRVAGANEGRSGKGGRFPVQDEARRAEVLGNVSGEQPMILDPCSDSVEDHLVYSPDGVVSGRTERGQMTIELLGLNRQALVGSRREIVARARLLISQLHKVASGGGHQEVIEALLAMTADDAPYAGIARQFVRSEAGSIQRAAPAIEETLAESTPVRSVADQQQAKAAQAAFREKQEDYSLEEESDAAFGAYVTARDRRIEWIKVRNLKAISRLDIPVDAASGDAPWLMLLGENASGKSTILQALALALIGEGYLDDMQSKFGLEPKRLVRYGEAFGEISVKLTGATEARTLKILADGTIEQSGRGAQLMVLAYGSTRLLPRRKSPSAQGRTYARIENLFDPFIPLTDAETWLTEVNEEQFDYAARALRIALSIAPDRQLVRKDGEVGLVENGTFVPLEQLCDGYQTTIALIADILEVALRAWKTPELAQGVVLLDEVGNHLHPSWKMQFVSSMRAILPGVQVIATTHEPLCLRGLRDGEVAVLRRGPRGGISMRRDLPSIEGMRIDQILTSEHFGLQSTLDPRLQALFDRYQVLLRIEEPSAAHLEEREKLRKEINALQDLGKTERERRLLDAIDRFLADKVVLETFDEIDAREAALDEELSRIWRSASTGAVQ